jgi:hypothetical protein
MKTFIVFLCLRLSIIKNNPSLLSRAISMLTAHAPFLPSPISPCPRFRTNRGIRSQTKVRCPDHIKVDEPLIHTFERNQLTVSGSPEGARDMQWGQVTRTPRPRSTTGLRLGKCGGKDQASSSALGAQSTGAGGRLQGTWMWGVWAPSGGRGRGRTQKEGLSDA